MPDEHLRLLLMARLVTERKPSEVSISEADISTSDRHDKGANGALESECCLIAVSCVSDFVLLAIVLGHAHVTTWEPWKKVSLYSCSSFGTAKAGPDARLEIIQQG